MGYLSCKADSSISTCRSLSAVATTASPHHRRPRLKRNAAATTAAASDVNSDEPSPLAAAPPAEPTSASSSRRYTGRGDGRGRQGAAHHFTYRQLEAATCNFSDDSLLGRGSHGSVYKAQLPSGHVLAVKRPSRIRHRHTPARLAVGGGGSTTTSTGGSSRLLGRNEVENEIEVLSRVHGPRLVNLLGFTNDSDDTVVSAAAAFVGVTGPSPSFRKERLLVMEYMPNGTLYDLLHSNPRPPGWTRRLRLALQTAKAIHSLHSHEPPVVHRDVKAANVLLDQGLNARLGDFGLAVFCPHGGGGLFSPSVRSTPPAGTLGYLDPGYITPENLSTKTDVFSFGILLLEIMSGRKAIDVAHSPPSIVEWAIPLMRKGKILALYDPRIAPPRDPVARRQLATLAARCVRSCRDRRPSMDEVVDQLKLLRRRFSSKAWNGLFAGNPCSAIETERTHSKLPSHNPECNPSSSPDSRHSSPRGVRNVAEDVPLSLRKPPIVVPVRASRNARRVFSEADPSSRNLMSFMNASDEENLRTRGIGSVGRQGSRIRRARTLHHDYNGRDNLGQMRRNRSLRGAFESLSMMEKDVILDARIQVQDPL